VSQELILRITRTHKLSARGSRKLNKSLSLVPTISVHSRNDEETNSLDLRIHHLRRLGFSMLAGSSPRWNLLWLGALRVRAIVATVRTARLTCT